MGLKNTCHHGKGVEQPMTACNSIYKQTKPPCLMQKSILHCTFGSILYVWVQCMPSCREELNFTFLFFENVSTEGQICFSTINVKKCRVKQFERGSKLQIHITQPFMCTMPTKIMSIWCNGVEMSQNKTFLLANSLGVLHDCPDPSLCLRHLFSSSVQVHSLIPMSNFSKCASITCWTKQRNIQYFIEPSNVSPQSECKEIFISPGGHKGGGICYVTVFLSKLLLSWKQQYCQYVISCLDQGWHELLHSWVHQEDER